MISKETGNEHQIRPRFLTTSKSLSKTPPSKDTSAKANTPNDWQTDTFIFFWMQCILFLAVWLYVTVQKRQVVGGLQNDASQTQSWCPSGKHITQGVRAHAQTVRPQLRPDWAVLKVFMSDEVWLELWRGYSPEALQQSEHGTFHYSPWQPVTCSSGYPHPCGAK